MPSTLRRWIAVLTFVAALASANAQTPPANGLLREVYLEIPGEQLANMTNSAVFPNSPSSTNYVTDFFESPTNIAENYGQRMRGFIVPPVTGDYIFWIATDDQGLLYLSTDQDPVHKAAIAWVNGWTSVREWTKEVNQQSAPIRLESGRTYYIEALEKEGGGGDNLAVRWQMPSGVIEEPIPASRLRPWGIAFTAPTVTQHPANTSAVEGGNATFSVRVSNVDAILYQWQRNGIDIAGANAPDYTRLAVALADNNTTYRCFLSNSLGTTFSNPATLMVTADQTRPTLVAAQNVSDNTVQLVFSEPVEATTATTPGNYQITGGLTITGAAFGADTKTVILTASAPFTFQNNYTVTVSGVKDRAVAQNVIVAGSQISFTALQYVPLDIGGGGAGQTTFVSGGFNVTGAGQDIGGTSDQFHFDYQQRTGNFDVKVRVQNLSALDMWTKAGLMARETLAANSRFAGAFATPSLAGAFSLNRVNTGGATAQTGFAPVNYPDTWLRLARSGTTFTSYASVDGQTWVNLGSVTLSVGPTIYLGAAVASRSPTQTVSAQFRDFTDATGGAFVSSIPLKGEPLAASSRRTGLIISEIMYHPPDRADGKDLEFIEFFNTDPVAENLTGYHISGAINYAFPDGTVVPSGGFLVLARDPAAVRAVYGIDNIVGPYADTLSNDSDVIEVSNELNATILEAHFSDKIGWPLAADGAGHSLVLARPSYGETQREAWSASALKGGSPGRAEPIRSDAYENLVINEILAHTDDPQKDYIEIYNHSNAAVDLAGCFLSDNRANTNRYTFPAGASIPARGFLAVDQDSLGFALKAGGETIYLVAPNDARVIDAVRFEGQANGVVYGRYPDGAARFTALQNVTQGAANAAPLIRNVVINEIMYHPISDSDDDEYIELFNQSPTSADISGWRFTDGIDLTFPAGTTIPAGGYMVVAKNAANLRAKYANLDASNLIGDYDGTLSNSGERVALSMPDQVTSTNEFGVVTTDTIYIVVCEVNYQQGGRWGIYADGGGSSLELIDPRADTTQPSSWANSNEESKSAWTTIEATGVLDNGGMSNPNQFQMHLQGGGECLVDDVEVRKGAGTNLITNPGFENNMTGWVAQGAFSKSVIESASGVSGTKALRVISPVRGDTGANRVRYNIDPLALTTGDTVTLRAKVRWLKGYPEFLLRLRGNWLEAFGRLSLPNNLGTPGQSNSRSRANIGPSIYEVAHTPVLPAASQAVVVTARVTDPDGVTTPQLKYRVDPTTTFTTVNMNDSGTLGDAVANDGIWSATFLGQTSGKLGAFYVQAADRAATPVTATFPAEAPARECYIRWGESQANNTFASYRIWMPQSTVDTWRTRLVLDNSPLDITFVYGNYRAVYNVGALYSGSPWHAGYDSPVGGICDYVVNFRDDELFLGSTDFVLASVGNLDNDDSAQREQAAFWMSRKLGAPFNHRRYIHMFVNGQRRGKIYEDSQQPNAAFLEGWFPEDSNGELLKIEDWFEFDDSANKLGNVDAQLGFFTTTGGALKTARYRWCWRPRAVKKSANDFTDFFELVRAANDGTSAYTTRLENVADMEEWMRVICMEHMVGNWDSYGYGRGKNMFTYRPGNGKWNLLPWDIDFVLGSGSDGPTTDMFGGVNDGNVGRMLNTPQFRRAYYRAMLDAVNGPLAPENLNPVLDARTAALRANGVNVPDNAPIKSYAATRRGHLQGLLNGVAATFAITSNNGNNFSTNKNFITITGTAPISVKTIEVNGAPYPVTWTAVTTWSMAIPLTAQSNALNLKGFDARGNEVTGATDTITITYTGALTSPKDNVVINEIMYNPAAPDASFIELANVSTAAAFDLSGFRLDGVDFIFPDGSVIAPNGYMVIAKSLAAFSVTYGSGIPVVGEFSGGLDNGGERLKLVKPGATPDLDEIIDAVRYDDDPPWPAAADGTGPSLQLIDPTKDNSRVGNWTVMTNAGFAQYTPGAVNNVKATLTAYPALWINEVLPNNTTGITDGAGQHEPWVELYNSGTVTLDLNAFYLTDTYTNLQKWRFPTGTSLNPGQFLLVWADNEPAQSVAGAPHTNFRLNPTNGSIALVRVQGAQPAVMDFINYNLPTANRSFGSYPDGQNFDRQLFHFPTPRLANDNTSLIIPVTINEWMASNTRTLADPADRQFEDWFELYNSSTEAVDLTGYYLTDLLTDTTLFRVPPGYMVPPQGYLLVWADGEKGQNVSTNIDLHADFKLSATGEEIGLFGADGTKIDSVAFGAQSDDISQGRYPDAGPAPFYRMPQPTPRAANVIPSGNRAPTLSGVASAIIPEDALYQFQATATDPDAGQTLTFSLVGAPATASINPSTGVFTWTPSETQGPGNFTFTVRVADNGTPSLSRSQQITLSVMESNRAPSLGNLSDVTIPEQTLYSFNVPATDPDFPAQPLQFFLDEGPAGATLNGNSGRFDWTPAEGQGPGVYPVTIRVVDGGSPAASDSKRFFITVRDVNAAPTLAPIPDALVTEGDTLAFYAVATDDDLPAQTLTFSMTGPATAQINAQTGRFTWTPAGAEIPTTNVITVRVTDSGSPAQTTSRSFTVVTAKFNHPPTFTALANQTAPEEADFSLQLQASDVDAGQTLTYALEGAAPAGVTLSSGGLLQWRPTEAQGPTTNPINFRVTDNGSPAKSVAASVTVVATEVNRAPSLAAQPDQSVKVGDTLTLDLSATDPDLPANGLTFGLDAGAPVGVAINAATGRLTWTPGSQYVNTTQNISVRVTDNGSPALSDSKTVVVHVDPPTNWKFVSVTGTASSSRIYIYLESPGEVIMDDLRLVAGPTTATGPNLLANGDFENGLNGWTVSPNHSGSYTTNVAKSGTSGVNLVASSGGSTLASSVWQDANPPLTTNAQYTISYWFVPNTNNINLTVRLSFNGIVARTNIFDQPNRAPVLGALADRQIPELVAYTFNATATDADAGQQLQFFMDEGPANATLNSAGRFNWTPTEAQGPGVYPVTIRVVDNGSPALSDSKRFFITVNEVNTTPTLQPISDATVIQGNTLVIDPVAADNDLPAQTLTYSMTGPATAQINAQTGRFTWTPTGPEIPTTNVITIRVTDSGSPAMSAARTFTVVTDYSNHPPILGALADVEIPEQVAYSFTATATDPDAGQQLQFFMDEGPSGATFNGVSRRFDWTPSEGQGPGTYPVTIRVTDNGSPVASASARFFITVNEANSVPTLAAIPNATVLEGNTLTINPVATDNDVPAQTLTFAFTGRATAQIDAQTGQFTWTPTAAEIPSTNTFTIRVTDSGQPAQSASRTFVVIADFSNHAPTFTPLADQSVQEENDFSLQLQARDQDAGQTLTYALEGAAPAGVTLSTAGLLQWKPTKDEGPSTNRINFRVTDNGSPVRSVTAFVTVIVTEPAPPPAIDLETSITATGEIQMVWDSKANVVYRVYARDDIEAGVWQNINEFTATGATTNFKTPVTGTTRFFKVVAQP